MNYSLTVTWGEFSETLNVASPYGEEWAKTRAISVFLNRHPEFERQLNCPSASFAERARVAMKLGLTVYPSVR